MALSAGLRELAVGAENEERGCAGASDTAGVLAEALATLVSRAHAATPLRSSCSLAQIELAALRAALGTGGPRSARLEAAGRRAGDLRIRTGAQEFIVFGRPPVQLRFENANALDYAMTADGTPGAIKAFGEPAVGHRAQQLLFGVLPTVG